MGIQINGNTNNINAGIGSLSIEDLNELDIIGVATASNFKTGSSNLHSTGLTVGNALVHSTGVNVGTGATVHCPATNTLTFGTDNQERLRLTSEGKLGLNFTSPTTIIHASGNNTVGTSVTMVLQSHDTANATSGIDLLARDNSNNNETCRVIAASGGAESVSLQFHTNNTEKLRITSAGDVAIGRDAALNNYTAGSTTTQLAVVKDGGAAGSGYHEVAHFTGGTDTDDTGAIVRITQFNNDRGLYIKGGRGTGDQAKAIFGLRNSSNSDSDVMTFTQGGKVSIGDAATHTFSAHSEGDDLVIGGAGWRGMTIYGEGGGGVIQFADNGDNRVGQILYYHAENSMSFRVNGNVTRLKIDSNGDVCVGNSGNPPWTETGGNYNNISLCGNDANSSGFLNLGNGAAASNADFDLARIKIHNGATEVARITGTSATSNSGDADIKFFTKKAGASLKEILRIRNDGFVETMYSENTGSYSLSASPTPRLRIRNDYGGDGIISSAQFFAKRGSGAASIFDIGVITTSTDYESNLIISSRNTDASYSEKWRIESEGQLRMNYGNNAKQAYALRSTFRTITGHSSTGFQYVRFAFLAARTPYRVCINTTGGNYGPGAQFFTVLRNWDNTTLYVSDKFNMGSAYANAVRMQSDNGGGDYYLELSINLTTTSQGFTASIIPIGANAGTMRTALQFYGSGMSNLTNTSSAHSL